MEGSRQNAMFAHADACIHDAGLEQGRLLRLYYQSYKDHPPSNVVEEHEAIIRAIEARDVELCDRLARAHADQIVRQIQTLLTNDQRDDPAL